MKTTRTTKMKLLLIGLVLFGTSNLWAQVCGTTHSGNPTIYYQPSTGQAARMANDLICIDVFFHIVKNGSNFSNPNLSDVINNLNRYFSPHNITFRNVGSQEISSATYTTLEDENEAEGLGRDYNRSRVINYYIVERLWNDKDGYEVGGTVLDIPSNTAIVKHSEVLRISSPHEMGHALGLYHTFSKKFGLSNPDSSNCTDTGDLVCDTPADTGSQSATGYMPDITNIMSGYFGSRTKFSKGQAVRMREEIRKDIVKNAISYKPTPNNTSISSDNTVLTGGTFNTLRVKHMGVDITYNTKWKWRWIIPSGSGYVRGASSGFTNTTVQFLPSNSLSSVYIQIEVTNTCGQTSYIGKTFQIKKGPSNGFWN